MKLPYAMKTSLKLIALLALSLCGLLEAREWTSADQEKTFSGDYVSSADGEVTIRRSTDRKVFKVALDQLSEDDQKWVAEKLTAEAAIANQNKEPDPELVKLLSGDWERHEGHGLQYRIFGERKLRKSSDKLYPLVIYLHGKDNDVMTPDEPWNAATFSEKGNYRKRPCLIIAPQAPNNGWKGEKADSVFAIAKELMKNFPIDPKRIYLTGYSMGSFGTFTLIAMQPDFFAAGVGVAGGGSPNKVAQLKDVPIWAFHGDADDVVKVDSSRRIVEALKAVDGKIKYTEIPGGDHGIATQVYAGEEMHEWLFEQQKQ